MATTKKSTARIMLRTVLEHVHALGIRMDKRFEAVDKRFDSLEAKLEVKIDGVERRLTRQIDGLDKRLDDVEIKEIPKLKKAVGSR